MSHLQYYIHYVDKLKVREPLEARQIVIQPLLFCIGVVKDYYMRSNNRCAQVNKAFRNTPVATP